MCPSEPSFLPLLSSPFHVDTSTLFPLYRAYHPGLLGLLMRSCEQDQIEQPPGRTWRSGGKPRHTFASSPYRCTCHTRRRRRRRYRHRRRKAQAQIASLQIAELSMRHTPACTRDRGGCNLPSRPGQRSGFRQCRLSNGARIASNLQYSVQPSDWVVLWWPLESPFTLKV
jgi:hypothetical protein